MRHEAGMSAIEKAIGRALASLCARLGIEMPTLTRVQYRKGTVTLSTSDAQTKGALTAPRSLLCELFRISEPMLGLRLWRPEGHRDPVSEALQRDGMAHDDWLALARALLEAGEHEEAQLLWLAADSLLSTDHEGGFFPRWPRAARIHAGAHSSPPSLVEKLLPLAKSKSAVEASIALSAIADAIAPAVFELRARPVQPARAARLIRALDTLLPAAESSRAPAVREAAHLLRWRYAFARDLHG